MDLAAFNQLIQQLQNQDNDIRSNAESTYDSIQPQQCLSMLLQYIENKSNVAQARVFVAILCRRLLLHKFEEAFGSLNDETKTVVKNQLLLTLVNEQESNVRLKISDIACALATELIDVSGNIDWPEFAQFMVECSRSEDASLREIGCLILASVPNIFGAQLRNNVNIINQMLSVAIQDPHSASVRQAALSGLAAFLGEYSNEGDLLDSLRGLATLMIQSIEKSINDDPDNDELLKSFVEIAESCHKYLRPYLLECLQLCYNILTNDQLGDPMRQLALEAIITLSENMPAAVRKTAKNLIDPLIGTLLEMMTDIDEEAGWETQDTPDENEDATNAITAELALDRFACALGSEHVLQSIIVKVPSMLQSQDWKHRQAGLMAVSACAEGCMKPMEKLLGSILQAVIPRLEDPHPRVRHAACNALGQMALDFGPKLQKNHHSTVIPALMSSLDDSCPRVQAIAGAAVVNFCEKAQKSILNNYLDAMIDKLQHVMAAKFNELVNNNRKLVLEQIVTTVASVADTAEEGFLPYYDKFMPVLKYIMEKAVDPQLKMLRGRTIECISLIGLAVGKEKFNPDAVPIMNLLLDSQVQGNNGEGTNNILEPDDPQISFMIGAWARICRLMGPDFEPYLPAVMPQVLQTASIKPDVCVVDNDQATAVDDDVNWQVVKLNQNQNFAIRTSGLEDKSTACRMLFCYARELKQAFAPYCESVLDIMLPTLRFYFSDEVRDAAAEIMPYLLDSLKRSRPDLVPGVWNKICSGLLNAIANEPNRELVADELEALAGCIEVLGTSACGENGMPGLISSQQLTDIQTLLDRMFHEHFEKDVERIAKRKDEDYDDVEEERLMNEKDDDEYVLSKIYEVMHFIFVTHNQYALPFFQTLVVHCLKLLEENRQYTDLQWGICFWNDVVEFGGQQSWSLKDYYLPVFMKSLTHPDKDVRQNAVSAIGVVAMHGSEEFVPHLTETIPILIRSIELPDSRNDDNNTFTENCISALTKIMKYRPQCLHQQSMGCTMDDFLAKWLSWLPIWEDDIETEYVYKQLCDLVESNNAIILGPDNRNIPHIVKSIAQAMATDGITPKTGTEDSFGQPLPNANNEKSVWDRCVSLLQHIYSNQPVFEACVNQLDDSQKKAIATALKLLS